MRNRGLALIAVPVLGTALLVCALAAHRDPVIAAKRGVEKDRSSAPAMERTAPARREASVRAPAPSRPPATPAPAEAVGRAAEQARIRATYQNYRTALATGNSRLADALRPTLLRDRDAALRLAEQDLAAASQAIDHEIARKTVEGLSR